MAPPKRPWFRMYVEAFSDRKLRRLTPAERWLWVAVLGAARKSPAPGHLMLTERVALNVEDLADFAAMDESEVETGLARMVDLGLLELDAGAWSVPKWGDRQFESDVTALRMSKRRRSDAVTTSDVTPPETETETDSYSVCTKETREGDPQPVDNARGLALVKDALKGAS